MRSDFLARSGKNLFDESWCVVKRIILLIIANSFVVWR